MGDGINDASALHAADVGISVDTAIDVLKDAADIVLLEKDMDVTWYRGTRREKNICQYYEVCFHGYQCQFWKHVQHGRCIFIFVLSSSIT